MPSVPPLLSSHKSLILDRMESVAQGKWHSLFPAWGVTASFCSKTQILLGAK